MENIDKKFSKLHEACKKYSPVQLANGPKKSGVCEKYSQEYLEHITKISARNGFIETFCLDDEQKAVVKSLRYKKN